VKILMGAQSCGFGPVSKLVAASRLLSEHHRIFAGETVAARFAQRNTDAFDEVIDLSSAGPGRLDELIKSADQIVSVMDSDLVFRAWAAGRPVLFIDSLLAFWQTRFPVSDLAARAQAATTDRYDPERLERVLRPHERILAAHVFATETIAQNFPGVPQRAAEIDTLRRSPLRLTGSIIDTLSMTTVEKGALDCDVLVNLGGFKNFLLDYDEHNSYLTLMYRWLRDFLFDRPEIRRVVVCSGAFGDAEPIRVGDRTVTFELMPQPQFLGQVAGTPHYLMTPGLTGLHEAMVLGQLPMGMPEEHYGHVANVRALSDSTFGRMAARFADVDPDYSLPEEDFAGTAAIVSFVRGMLSSESAYARFRTEMSGRIDRYLAMGAAERRAGIAELEILLGGEPFAAAVTAAVGADIAAGSVR
jgi:hypothetical protein